MKFWKFSSFSLLLSLFISSCSPTALIYTLTPEQSKPTMEQVSPTQKPTLEATVEVGATATPTMTSMPTISPADVEAQVIALLKNNGGCRLPCFWGLTPGQTEGEKITSILAKVGGDRRIVINHDDLLMETLVTVGGNSGMQVKPLSWLEIHTKAYKKRENGINVIYGDPYYSEYFKYYTLPYLLSTYGPPENIFVFLDSGIADMGLGVDLYLLHLDYPKQGWVAHLQMPLNYKDNLLVGCPSEAFTNLRLWSPSNPSRDYELTPSDLFTIEEATGMTIEEFYEKFKNPANTDCLETPSDIHK
jgi:hypothetical protein